MRTTLDIDDDVLQLAKELAARERKSAGQVVSELARRGAHAAPTGPPAPRARRRRNGFEVAPAGGRIVTSELVRAILDSDEQS